MQPLDIEGGGYGGWPPWALLFTGFCLPLLPFLPPSPPPAPHANITIYECTRVYNHLFRGPHAFDPNNWELKQLEQIYGLCKLATGCQCYTIPKLKAIFQVGKHYRSHIKSLKWNNLGPRLALRWVDHSRFKWGCCCDKNNLNILGLNWNGTSNKWIRGKKQKYPVGQKR